MAREASRGTRRCTSPTAQILQAKVAAAERAFRATKIGSTRVANAQGAMVLPDFGQIESALFMKQNTVKAKTMVLRHVTNEDHQTFLSLSLSELWEQLITKYAPRDAGNINRLIDAFNDVTLQPGQGMQDYLNRKITAAQNLRNWRRTHRG